VEVVVVQGSESTGGQIELRGVAQELAELARSLDAASDPTAVLEQVVAAAVVEIPGAELAGVSIIGKHRVTTPVCTNELVGRIDELQYQTGQGPCLDAAADRHVVRVDDLSAETRWPRFCARAAALGVRSALAFQLFTDGGSIGALNIYARPAQAFPAHAEDIGAPLATHAALAMVAKRTEANLRVALDSRDVIGQAKGILMERYKMSADQAFSLLLVASQRTNTKLRDVAAELTRTGELPTPTHCGGQNLSALRGRWTPTWSRSGGGTV
jgi:GAF domain-containing protein